MEYKDYYQILGVARNASASEIKGAYRKLAMQFHPDRNPGDKQAEERFKEMNEAYQVLSDPQKRARYNQLGHPTRSGSSKVHPATLIGASGPASRADTRKLISTTCLEMPASRISSVPFSAVWPRDRQCAGEDVDVRLRCKRRSRLPSA